MAKAAKFLEIPATITERGQTTVPAAIRKMLNLGKGDRVVFKGMADGTVIIARKEEAENAEADDPVIGRFLAFLAGDMAKAPQRIRPIPRNLVNRAKALIAGVEVDLDAALPDEDS